MTMTNLPEAASAFVRRGDSDATDKREPLVVRVYSMEWDVYEGCLALIRSHVADAYETALEDVQRSTGLTTEQAELACYHIQDIYKTHMWDSNVTQGEAELFSCGRVGQLRDKCDMLLAYTKEERQRESIEG